MDLTQSHESCSWLLQKIEFIGDIGTVQSYLEKWGKRVNFGNGVAEITRKSMRESKDKWCDGGGRKNLGMTHLMHSGSPTKKQIWMTIEIYNSDAEFPCMDCVVLDYVL